MAIRLSLDYGYIPTVRLNHEYKSGFFKLLRAVTELSFPHDIELCLRGTTAKEIGQFEILPLVHLMIKALVQRRASNASESFCRTTDSRLLNSSHFPRLSYRLQWDHPIDYAFLRSVASHWLNMTIFHGGRYLPSQNLTAALHRPPISAMSI